MFTDIEGSTRLWAEHPAEMRDALARHDGIVGDAVVSAGGRVFKHTGDGVAAVFALARDAVLAASHIERQLGQVEWGALGDLRVRIGIHAGEADPRGTDWFGPAVNRVARLMGIGHGGQVLLSDSAPALLVEGMPAGLAVRDLGAHRLRGLAGAGRVWQLVGDDLAARFPPLRSLGGPRGNLPSQVSCYVGREADLAALGDLVPNARLVTLVGAGGMGKTRSALQIAGTFSDDYADGVWFVELAPVSDSAAVDHALIGVLGLLPHGGQTTRDYLLETLRDWRTLIVVDNCEHLLDGVADLIGDVLAACPDVSVLATSREPLGLPGEHVWPIGPLSPDGDASELFRERAALSRPRYILDDTNRGLVTSICSQLDGMPLAIELAAARLRSMSLEELADRLKDRFRVLGLTTRGDPRHSTLTAVVEWSARPDSDELITLAVLDRLVSRSLVVASNSDSGTRYSLLETMRQYGKSRLEPEGAEDLARHHAEHYAVFAGLVREGVNGPDEAMWVRRMSTELDNFRAASNFAVRSGDVDLALRLVGPLDVYSSTALVVEVWEWAESALTLPGAPEHPMAVWANHVAAIGCHYRGDPVGAERYSRRALAVERTVGLRPDPRSLLYLFLGLVQGDLAASRDAAQQAYDTAAERGVEFDNDRVEALFYLVYGDLGLGRRPEISTIDELVNVARRLGSAHALAQAGIAGGLALLDAAPARARELFKLTHLAESGGLSRILIATLPAYLALLDVETDPQAALANIDEMAERYRSIGVPYTRIVLRDLIPVFARLGHYETVAIMDGAGFPYTIVPLQVTEAIAIAREGLGQDRYEQLLQKGRAITDNDELIDLTRWITTGTAPEQDRQHL